MKTFSVRLNVSNKFKDYAKSRFHIKSKNAKTNKTNQTSKKITRANWWQDRRLKHVFVELPPCPLFVSNIKMSRWYNLNIQIIQQQKRDIYINLPKTKVNRKDNNTINVKCEMSFKISFKKFSSCFSCFFYGIQPQSKPNNNNNKI